MADGHESGEGIALAGAISLRLEEGLNKFWSIRDERLGVLIDRSDSPNCILPYVGVTVFQARTRGREKGLDKFRLAELAQESKGVASNILVGVLKVIPNTVTRRKIVT